ncbi:MAG: hypothetical protein QME05_01050, partial [Candidatus Margulisbacteria bacterium]|nr:hypothetical protein [Candidatus Margulisiibacteriota bacterium]
MSKILLICDDYISSKMAGPGQRYIEMSQVLSKNHLVYLLADFEKGYIPPKGINIINPTISFIYNLLGIKITIPNPIIKKIINQYDVVITQGCLLQSFNWLRKVKKPLILDLYCPWFFEDLESRRRNGRKPVYNMLHPILKMLRYGDFFICANEKQRDFYLALLLLNNQTNLKNYSQDPSLRKLIDLVPAGLSSKPPLHSKQVLKAVLPGINKGDKVLLWFGGLWDWLDPQTPV